MLAKEILPLFYKDSKVLVFDSHVDSRGGQKEIANGTPEDLMTSFIADLEVTLIDAGWQDELCIDVIYSDRLTKEKEIEIFKKAGILK